MEYKRYDREAGKTRTWYPEKGGSRALAGTKLSPEDIHRATNGRIPLAIRSDGDRESRVKSAPSVKTFSIFEVQPQGTWMLGRVVHHTDTFTDYLTSELHLKSKPRVRWFCEVAEGVKSGPGWATFSSPGDVSCDGFFNSATREVWIKTGLSSAREKQVLAHEFRHCWQFDNLGAELFGSMTDVVEADASAYDKTWRGY